MKYEDFEKFVREKCVYETIYEDSEGRQILVVQMLDAYGMVNKAQREWVGLTDEEIKDILDCGRPDLVNIKKAEAKLKEKNG
jgi:hypothetical protein